MSVQIENRGSAEYPIIATEMHARGIFVFGTTFHKETKRDAISALPLELSWRIFSYLDDTSLRTAVHTLKIWAHIIHANRKLRNRLNQFELAIKLGSANLAKFHRRNKRKLKKENRRNYLPRSETSMASTKTTVLSSKRSGDDLVVHTKRFRIF